MGAFTTVKLLMGICWSKISILIVRRLLQEVSG